MTDFTPGAIITRESLLWDGDRPSWLRDDVRVDVKWQLMWFSDLEKPFVHAESVYNWPGVTAIRLDASDIVYQCIAWNEAHPDEPVMWPWYGGDEAPADWDGGEVLFRDGSLVRSPSSWKHPWTKGFGDDKQTPIDIIGYRKRRPTTSLPEPAEEVERREPDANRNPYRSMSKCDRCGKLWPSAATGVVHKCECSGGFCKPIAPEPAEEGVRIDPLVTAVADIIGKTVSGPNFRDPDWRAAHRKDQETAAVRILEHLNQDTNEFVPAYSAVATAKHYAELAGGVFVPFMAENELTAICAEWCRDDTPAMSLAAYIAKRLGLLRTPLDIAKAEHPDIPAEIVERIAAIVTKGEAK